MRENNRIHHRRIFLRFLVPYIIILVIPALMGLYAYGKTLSVIEEETIQSNLSLLEQSKQVLDRRVTEVERFVQLMATDPKIISFQYVKEPFKNENTYKIIDTGKRLYNYSLLNNFMFNYYILFKNSNLALSSNTTYDLPNFYEHLVNYTNVDYSSWYDEFLGKYYQRHYMPVRKMTIEGNPHEMVSYIHSLGYPNYFQGVVLVLIDNREIQNLLKGLDISEGGWAYIADQNGQMISYISNEEQVFPLKIDIHANQGVLKQAIGNRDFMITYTTSDVNGWKYVVAQPSHIVLKKINYLKQVTLDIFLTTLGIGGLIVLFMAYRDSRPIRALVNLIREHQHGEGGQAGVRNAFGFIENTLFNLYKGTEQLQLKMKEQMPLVRGMFFESLFKGEFRAKEELENALKHSGLNIQGSYFTVCLVDLSSQQPALEQHFVHQIEQRHVRIKEIISETVQNQGFIHDIDQDKMALLLVFQCTTLDECSRQIGPMMQQITEKMSNEQWISPVFAVGGTYEQLMDVSLAYREAWQAFYFKVMNWQNDVLWFNELPKNNENYYYPEEIEVRLMNSAKAGDLGVVHKLLSDLYDMNFTDRHLTIIMFRLLLNEMWGSIIRLADQVKISEKVEIQDIHGLNRLETFDDALNGFKRIKELYSEICSAVNDRKKSRNADLIEGVKRFIECGYKDPDLSLTIIADQFHVSEVYLSQFFKEQTGINFFDYLEGTRMKQAKELLSLTELPVNVIALSVGYTSSNSFARAFKRIHGISATVYRKTMDGNTELSL